VQAIILGPPSDDFTGDDGRVHRIGEPFRELSRCFRDVKHWTVHPMQATQDEVVLDPGRMGKIPDGGIDKMPRKQRDDFETKRMWDASVIINIPKLIKLVEKGLA
jgi:hypothetical protein